MGTNPLMYATVVSMGTLGAALLVWYLMRTYQPGAWRRRFVAARESGNLFIVLAVVVPCGYLLLVPLLARPFGGSMVVRVLDAIPMACMFAAIQILGLARRPVGNRLRCSKCKYDLAGLPVGKPHGTGGSHDARCPECGEHWGWPGGSERANREWRVKWLVLGGLLLLPLGARFASVPIMGILWWNRAVLRVAPTASIVQEVLTQRGFTNDAWAELSGRKVAAADTARIADRLLSRPAGAYFDINEIGWLTGALAAKSINARLIEPRMGRMFDASARQAAGGYCLLDLKPVATEFGPFAMMEVSVTVAPHIAAGLATSSTVVVAGSGSALYRAYVMGPFLESPRAGPPRFRGTMTVLLGVPGTAPPPVDAQGRILAIGGWLYRVDVPLDVPVEPGN